MQIRIPWLVHLFPPKSGDSVCATLPRTPQWIYLTRNKDHYTMKYEGNKGLFLAVFSFKFTCAISASILVKGLIMLKAISYKPIYFVFIFLIALLEWRVAIIYFSINFSS